MQDKSGLSVAGFAPRTYGIEGGVDIDLDASTAGRTAGRVGLGAFLGHGVGGVALGIAALAGVALTGGLAAGLLLGGAALGAVVGGLVGGYRYTQTITTNVPADGATSPYVDPQPNDDDKPFYWTDGEERDSNGTFHDSPTRQAPRSGSTDWDAVVSITEVTGRSVTVLDSLTYGFSMDSSSSLTARPPKAASSGEVGSHVATLSSEFADWTFTRPT